MRAITLALAAASLGSLALGATCSPPPPVPPDSGDAAPMPPLSDAAPTPVDGGDCARACSALQALGCTLGSKPDCATVEARDLGSGKVPNPVTHHPLTCADVAAVTTKAQAQALNYTCP